MREASGAWPHLCTHLSFHLLALGQKAGSAHGCWLTCAQLTVEIVFDHPSLAKTHLGQVMPAIISHKNNTIRLEQVPDVCNGSLPLIWMERREDKDEDNDIE